MRYKISYIKKYDNEGTVYTQTLNVKMTRNEFKELNYKIATAKLNAPSWKTNYKLYLDTFKIGVNYTTLTQTRFFAEYYGIIDSYDRTRNERFKLDRNTIVIININENVKIC